MASSKRRKLMQCMVEDLINEATNKAESIKQNLTEQTEPPSWCIWHMCGSACTSGKDCMFWGWPAVWCDGHVKGVISRGGSAGCTDKTCGFYHPEHQEVLDKLEDIKEGKVIAEAVSAGTEKNISRDTVKSYLRRNGHALLEELLGDDNPRLQAFLKSMAYTYPSSLVPHGTCRSFLVGMPCDCDSHPPVALHLLPACPKPLTWHIPVGCPFPHVTSLKDFCPDFLKGSCPRRLLCNRKHTYVV
eukprot:TRINITY_DN14814_c0_g2_i1.p1 TRINITY_DN14814_c0_g2~~TRINITY_DN14814_c0_g2_i1.p1  ORF type:complete len:244 (+),score=31.97 TRINITY_DN14814_c0_g2_i1:106-837(+)